MILAKRVKKAFAYDAQGKLSPIGENIFQFNRRNVVHVRRNKVVRALRSISREEPRLPPEERK